MKGIKLEQMADAIAARNIAQMLLLMVLLGLLTCAVAVGARAVYADAVVAVYADDAWVLLLKPLHVTFLEQKFKSMLTLQIFTSLLHN